MRRLFSLPLSLALIAGSALWLTPPTLAQQPAAPVPSPMTAATAPAAGTDPALLVILPPPGAKLRVEMDARSEDLLGMVKSFLKGIGETGEPIVTVSGPAAGQTPAAPNPLAQAIAGGDLAAMLKDVNHVHFAVYEITASAPPLVQPASPTPGKLPTKKAAFVAPAPPAPAFDSNAFYESAFASEGAHRLMYADADVYKLLMVGFPDKRGFAFAVSGGGYVAVERSDGYPNLEVLTAFISHVTTAVLNSKTGKKMMDSTFNPTATPDKTPDPSAKILPAK